MNAVDQAADRDTAAGTRRAGVAIAIIVTCQLMVVLDKSTPSFNIGVSCGNA